MDRNACAEAAQLIAKARRDKTLLKALPDSCRPKTLEEGYAIQHAFLADWDAPTAGWKCAATAADVQEAYSISAPFYGRLFAPTVYDSPARPAAGDFGHLCIETEFAFRFSASLPPREATYGREEIADAIGELIPAFEIISPRFDSLLIGDVPTCAADCAINGGAVLGAPCTDWRKLDLASHEVTFLVNGKVRGEGTGAKALGHPLTVLEWLVGALSRDGFGLRAGDVVLTGTCTGFHMVQPGDEVIGDFGDLGRVEVSFR